MDTDTNSGVITNYPVDHELLKTNVFTEKYQNVYKPIGGITKQIEYIYGTKYETITDDISIPDVYYRLYFEIYE